MLWLAKVCPEKAIYAFSKKFEIWPKTGFFTHNCCYRYASKSIKGSIDVDFDLVFNKRMSKEWVNGLGPRAGQRRPNFQNMPSLWRHLQKTPNPKRKTFESVEGLNSSLAQSSGELWVCKCLQKCGFRGTSRVWQPWQWCLHHYNCLLLIVFLPLTDVHVMLKRMECERRFRR